MQKRMRLFCIGLLTVCILCSCSSESNLIEVGNTETKVADNNVGSENTTGNDIAYTVNGSAWCSALFEEPSTQYDNQLALVAAEMSKKSVDTTGEGIKNCLMIMVFLIVRYIIMVVTAPLQLGMIYYVLKGLIPQFLL